MQIIKSVSFAKKLFLEAKKSALKSDTCRSLIENCLSSVNNPDNKRESIYSPILELANFLNKNKDVPNEKSSSNQNVINSTDQTKIEKKAELSNNDVKIKEESTNTETKNIKPTTSQNATDTVQSEDKNEDDDDEYAGLSEKDKKTLMRIKKLDKFCMVNKYV